MREKERIIENKLLNETRLSCSYLDVNIGIIRKEMTMEIIKMRTFRFDLCMSYRLALWFVKKEKRPPSCLF